jgi:hypothetical protein
MDVRPSRSLSLRLPSMALLSSVGLRNRSRMHCGGKCAGVESGDSSAVSMVQVRCRAAPSTGSISECWHCATRSAPCRSEVGTSAHPRLPVTLEGTGTCGAGETLRAIPSKLSITCASAWGWMEAFHSIVSGKDCPGGRFGWHSDGKSEQRPSPYQRVLGAIVSRSHSWQRSFCQLRSQQVDKRYLTAKMLIKQTKLREGTCSNSLPIGSFDLNQLSSPRALRIVAPKRFDLRFSAG